MNEEQLIEKLKETGIKFKIRDYEQSNTKLLDITWSRGEVIFDGDIFLYHHCIGGRIRRRDFDNHVYQTLSNIESYDEFFTIIEALYKGKTINIQWESEE